VIMNVDGAVVGCPHAIIEPYENLAPPRPRGDRHALRLAGQDPARRARSFKATSPPHPGRRQRVSLLLPHDRRAAHHHLVEIEIAKAAAETISASRRSDWPSAWDLIDQQHIGNASSSKSRRRRQFIDAYAPTSTRPCVSFELRPAGIDLSATRQADCRHSRLRPGGELAYDAIYFAAATSLQDQPGTIRRHRNLQRWRRYRALPRDRL